ncbi:hypothetical protein FKP32DRAFT_124460 [Trametes sanguinea]|nr:hypothetical protein FKP32DRAFT_124460 [Trametes sanguinea]
MHSALSIRCLHPLEAMRISLEDARRITFTQVASPCRRLSKIKMRLARSFAMKTRSRLSRIITQTILGTMDMAFISKEP